MASQRYRSAAVAAGVGRSFAGSPASGSANDAGGAGCSRSEDKPAVRTCGADSMRDGVDGDRAAEVDAFLHALGVAWQRGACAFLDGLGACGTAPLPLPVSWLLRPPLPLLLLGPDSFRCACQLRARKTAFRPD